MMIWPEDMFAMEVVPGHLRPAGAGPGVAAAVGDDHMPINIHIIHYYIITRTSAS